jgi:hypothetical protein
VWQTTRQTNDGNVVVVGPAVPTRVGSVRDWTDERVVAHSGSKLRCKGEAFADYCRWCADRKVRAVTWEEFRKAMRALGFEVITRNKRGSYADVALGLMLSSPRASPSVPLYRRQQGLSVHALDETGSSF